MEQIPEPARNSFNAVRLLAALQVAYVHAVAHLHLTPIYGHELISQFPGVPIFFAASGFLVFDSLMRLSSNRAFFRHRALRIYPALFTNIVILELCFAIGGGLHINMVGPVKAFFFEIIYLLTASDELGFRYASARAMRSFDGFFQIYPSGVLWTLTVELTFYTIVPLFRFAEFQKFAASILVAGLCGLSIFTNGLIEKSLLFSLSIIPYFWMFGIGMLLRLWLPKMPPIVTPLLFATILVCSYQRGLAAPEWKVAPDWITILQTVALCWGAVLVGTGPLLRSQWLADNDISYGLYLYHMLFVAIAISSPFQSLTAILFFSMLAGYLSWRLVERPAMKWRHATNTGLSRDALKAPA
jgi:peptidoglycan/LPS O-acetylase OafA/YrhL